MAGAHQRGQLGGEHVDRVDRRRFLDRGQKRMEIEAPALSVTHGYKLVHRATPELTLMTGPSTPPARNRPAGRGLESISEPTNPEFGRDLRWAP